MTLLKRENIFLKRKKFFGERGKTFFFKLLRKAFKRKKIKKQNERKKFLMRE